MPPSRPARAPSRLADLGARASGALRGTISAPALLALVVAAGLFHALTLRPEGASHGDVLQVLVHAENLVGGEPYAATGYIQNPKRFYAPVGYPPGYPLLLAPFVALFGGSMEVVRGVALGLLTVGVGALAFLIRRSVSAGLVGLFVLAAGLQPYLWEAKHLGFSGFIVLGLASASLLLYETESPPQPGRRLDLRHLAAGLVAGVAVSTHPLAWALPLAFLAGDLLRERRVTRRFGWAIAGVAVGTLALAVLVDTTAGAQFAPSARGSGRGGGYGSLLLSGVLQELGRIPGRVVARLWDYGRTTYVFWYAPVPGGDLWKYALLLASLVPVGWGWVLRLRRAGTAEAFGVIYVAGLLPWGFADVRYVIPLVPLYYVYLVTGLDAMVQRSATVGRVAVALTVLALVGVYGARYALDVPTRPDRDMVAAYDYIRTQTPADAVFVTNSDPRQIAYQAGRSASLAPNALDLWPEYAAGIGASHVLVRTSRNERLPIDPRYQAAFERGRWTVYRIPPDALPEPPAVRESTGRRGDARDRPPAGRRERGRRSRSTTPGG